MAEIFILPPTITFVCLFAKSMKREVFHHTKRSSSIANEMTLSVTKKSQKPLASTYSVFKNLNSKKYLVYLVYCRHTKQTWNILPFGGPNCFFVKIIVHCAFFTYTYDDKVGKKNSHVNKLNILYEIHVYF